MTNSTTPDSPKQETAANKCPRCTDTGYLQFSERLNVLPERNSVTLSHVPLITIAPAITPIASLQGRYGLPRRGEWPFPEMSLEFALVFSLLGMWTSLDPATIDIVLETGALTFPVNALGLFFTAIDVTYTAKCNHPFHTSLPTAGPTRICACPHGCKRECDDQGRCPFCWNRGEGCPVLFHGGIDPSETRAGEQEGAGMDIRVSVQKDELIELDHWRNDVGGTITASEGNAFIDGFRVGRAKPVEGGSTGPDTPTNDTEFNRGYLSGLEVGIRRERAAAASVQGETLSDRINALPEWARQHIHDIETKCDPAGDIRTIGELRDSVAALEAEIAEIEQLLPETFFKDRRLTFRIERLVSSWQCAVNSNVELEKRAEAAETLVGELRTGWREEFPCLVIHQDYPNGSTCLDQSDFAVRNKPPYRYGPELRQRYADWDRTLFCDNCWSCHKLARAEELLTRTLKVKSDEA